MILARRRVAIAIAGFIATSLHLLPAAPVQAGIDFNASFAKGTLTVKLQPAGFEMSCSSGDTLVNTEPALPAGLVCTQVKALKVIGTNGPDVIDTSLLTFGTGFPNLGAIVLDARGGDDLFLPGPLKETMLGGTGMDEIEGAEPQTNVVATDAKYDADGPADTIKGIESLRLDGSNGADTINLTGFSGDARVYGHDGDDVLAGGSGNDQLFGGSGNDVLRGNGGGDLLDDEFGSATEGTDTFNGGQGRDIVVEAGSGDITITANAITGTGSDTHASVEEIRATTTGSDASINAGSYAGVGRLTALGGGSNTLMAGPGGSTLESGDGADTLTGGTGVDHARLWDVPGAVVTNSLVTTSQGNDAISSIEHLTILGTSGDDVVDASAYTGRFVFSDDEGLDTVTSGPGDDWVSTAGGAPLSLGAGTDTYVAHEVQVDATLTNASLVDDVQTTALSGVEIFQTTALVGAGTFDASGWSGPTLVGSNDDEAQTFIGGPMRDIFDGGKGNDLLQGMAGNDRLFGKQGNDQLQAGAGSKDFCDGGNGADAFTSCETYKN